MEDTRIVDISNPAANMYGCLPCPRCAGVYRWPNQQGEIQCDDCGFTEPAVIPGVEQ